MIKIGEYKQHEIFFNPKNRNFVAKKENTSVDSSSYSSLCRKISGGRGRIISFDEHLRDTKATYIGNDNITNSTMTGNFARNSVNGFIIEIITEFAEEKWVSAASLFSGHFAEEYKSLKNKQVDIGKKLQDLRGNRIGHKILSEHLRD